MSHDRNPQYNVSFYMYPTTIYNLLKIRTTQIVTTILKMNEYPIGRLHSRWGHFSSASDL